MNSTELYALGERLSAAADSIETGSGLATVANGLRKDAIALLTVFASVSRWDTTADVIIAAVSAAHGIKAESIEARWSTRASVAARDMAAFYMRATGATLSEVGERLGGRDHTTIIAALRRYESRRDESLHAEVSRTLRERGVVLKEDSNG